MTAPLPKIHELVSQLVKLQRSGLRDDLKLRRYRLEQFVITLREQEAA